MLKKVRLQLSLLYALVATALIVLVGGGTYGLMRYYFQQTTDLALQHQLVHELSLLGAQIPGELLAADRDWSVGRIQQPVLRERDHETEGDERHESEYLQPSPASEPYSAERAAIFVLPLDRSGQLQLQGVSPPTLIEPDGAALAQALATGLDWRTITLLDGSRARLLTWKIEQAGNLAALQLGRPLDDQDRVLSQLLFGLLAMGGLSTILLGLGSWWLAGRSMRPAQLAWERQQTFIANASHELRAPLTLIRANAEVARRTAPQELVERQQLLDDLLQESDHMNRLVDDLLLLSRLDAGRLALHQRSINAAELLADVARKAGRLAEQRSITLQVEQAAGMLWADPTRMHQVLLILVDNALRYTGPGGKVCLSATAQSNQVRLQVRDSGCGIAAQHLPHIFERFYRVESERGTESRGSGLGLSIARALIEAQSGQITLESTVGVGTRVSVLLPAALE